MRYDSKEMEMRAALDAAARVCAAARTAPKACGVDRIHTLTLTEADKEAVADEMQRLGEKFGAGYFLRDAACVRASQALVLIGIEEGTRGLNEHCGYCHYANCGECAANGGVCMYDPMDVGIALGSAAATAADCRMDNRILFTAGRAALELGLLGEKVKLIYGLPLAAAGKSPFFDRKPKKIKQRQREQQTLNRNEAQDFAPGRAQSPCTRTIRKGVQRVEDPLARFPKGQRPFGGSGRSPASPRRPAQSKQGCLNAYYRYIVPVSGPPGAF